MKNLCWIVLCIAGVSVIGCSDGGSSDPIVKVADDDARMNLAMEKARATFPKFVENWKAMPSDSVSVKIGVPTSAGGEEHIWFEPTEITDTEVTGVCSNEPADVPGLSLGDTRTYDRTMVSDWMIMEGSTCYGGYTIRVLMEIAPDDAPPLKFAEL